MLLVVYLLQCILLPLSSCGQLFVYDGFVEVKKKKKNSKKCHPFHFGRHLQLQVGKTPDSDIRFYSMIDWPVSANFSKGSLMMGNFPREAENIKKYWNFSYCLTRRKSHQNLAVHVKKWLSYSCLARRFAQL